MPSPAGVQFSKPAHGKAGHRIVVYGPGGIGKTTLAARLPGKTAYADIDESLRTLAIGAQQLTFPANDWSTLRGSLQTPGWDDINNIVIESGTKAEELAAVETLATVKNEKDQTMKRIEEYGYGKGYQYLFETFMGLLVDLDQHARAGRNVVIICHDCTNNVPNPAGIDWLRYEPRLQSPSSGKASIRLRVREWADHVLFIGYDVSVNKESKGSGSGTRTIYTAELPHCMAKSRTTQEPIPVIDGENPWTKIIGK